MKFSTFIPLLFVILITSGIHAQKTPKHKNTNPKNCSCRNNPLLKDLISCDTTFFTNGSRLYRQFNCDSSWLTFENKKGFKKLMDSMDKSTIGLTERLGYQFAREYKTALLFENRQASGGGFPINFELINKENGELLEELGTIIYYSDNTTGNYILYLTSDSLDTLTYYNMDSGKKYNFSIPGDRLLKTVQESSSMFVEFLFDEPKTVNQSLLITYKYLVSESPEKWSADDIVIDLTKTN
jgi:hypothetical protein